MSRDGEHKVVALWRYDKRDYYGSPELRVKVRVRVPRPLGIPIYPSR